MGKKESCPLQTPRELLRETELCEGLCLGFETQAQRECTNQEPQKWAFSAWRSVTLLPWELKGRPALSLCSPLSTRLTYRVKRWPKSFRDFTSLALSTVSGLWLSYHSRHKGWKTRSSQWRGAWMKGQNLPSPLVLLSHSLALQKQLRHTASFCHYSDHCFHVSKS